MHSISSNAKLTNGRNPQDDLANKSVVDLNLNVDIAQELTTTATNIHLHLVGITLRIVSILIEE